MSLSVTTSDKRERHHGASLPTVNLDQAELFADHQAALERVARHYVGDRVARREPVPGEDVIADGAGRLFLVLGTVGTGQDGTERAHLRQVVPAADYRAIHGEPRHFDAKDAHEHHGQRVEIAGELFVFTDAILELDNAGNRLEGLD